MKIKLEKPIAEYYCKICRSTSYIYKDDKDRRQCCGITIKLSECERVY